MYVIKVGFRKYLAKYIKIDDEYFALYTKKKIVAKRYKTERNAHTTAKKITEKYKLVKVKD